MDMGSTTMSMASTATEAAASATSSAMSMSMSMDMDSTCQVSMLWNWYTIDACFISSTWHITSRSMFAGSCIGVILLVVSLEFLRRVSKEYDAYILRQYQRSFLTPTPISNVSPASTIIPGEPSCSKESEKRENVRVNERTMTIPPFRPHIVQQIVRATLHMLQFAAAYFIMLLAMYFNGYIIISIIIGAWIGAFIFTWETVTVSALGGPKEEATYCCG